MPLMVKAIDHLVLTVADLSATVAFYEVLGLRHEKFQAADGTHRHALIFGDQKINLHIQGAEFEPKARKATPGSGDLCFLSDTPLEDWQGHLEHHGIAVELGPVPRTGAAGPLNSLYVRDPDGNLIEISNVV